MAAVDVVGRTMVIPSVDVSVVRRAGVRGSVTFHTMSSGSCPCMLTDAPVGRRGR